MKHIQIKGYEGLYEVSEDGRIFNIKRGRYLVNVMTERYFVVLLYKNNKRKMYYVHRLVADAFCYKPEGKNQVNHIDLNKTNNHFTNLEWVTVSENVKHYRNSDKYVRPKMTKEGKESRRKKLMKKVLCKKTGVIYDSIFLYSKSNGISMSQASIKLNGKYKNNLNAELL